jgi:hypothetical protein
MRPRDIGAGRDLQNEEDEVSKSELPQVLQMEHQELNDEIWKATKLGGETGRAAKSVVRVLLPHVLLEEEFALPPLSILPSIARGEITSDMAWVVPKSERLKAEMPRMLADHQLIVQDLQNLLRAATKEKHVGYASFAQKLILHAQWEEEVLYPAAVLVGEYLKWKLGLP